MKLLAYTGWGREGNHPGETSDHQMLFPLVALPIEENFSNAISPPPPPPATVCQFFCFQNCATLKKETRKYINPIIPSS